MRSCPDRTFYSCGETSPCLVLSCYGTVRAILNAEGSAEKCSPFRQHLIPWASVGKGHSPVNKEIQTEELKADF